MSIISSTEVVSSKKNLNTYLNFKTCQYLVKFSAIIGDSEEQIDLTERITEFKMFHIYYDFMFPVVKIKLDLTKDLHNTITNNFKTIVFKLDVSIINVNLSDISDQDILNNTVPDIWLENEILVPSDLDRTKFTDEEANEETGFTENFGHELVLELFKKEHLEIVKNVLNGVYTDVRMKDLVAYLLKSTNMDMIIQLPDNEVLNDQVILPAKNIIKTLYYIQENYGIYYTGLRLFFDFDRGYCLPKRGNELGKLNTNEIIDCILYIGDNTSKVTEGFYEDKERNCYHLVLPYSDLFNFKDISNKELYGEEIIIKSTNTNSTRINTTEQQNLKFIEDNENTTNSRSGTKRTKYYYNTTNNPYLESEILFERTVASFDYMLRGINIDLRILTMNKNYYLSFMDSSCQNYEGLYVLNGMVTDFTKFRPNLFTSTTIMQFYPAQEFEKTSSK